MKKINEGILMGRDRWGRGILLTPDGDFRSMFVPREVKKGQIVQFKSLSSWQSSVAVAVSITAMAVFFTGMGWGYRFWDHKGLAQLNTPNPPRGEIYATLNLGSPEKIELDLDEGGRIVLVRIHGKDYPQHKALGHLVSETLKDRQEFFAELEINSGEPLGCYLKNETEDSIQKRKGSTLAK
jgi:hypothetical protein